MSSLQASESPTNFEQRCTAVANTLAKLAKWCHCNHTEQQMAEDVKNPDVGGVHSFNETVATAIKRDRVPAWIDQNTFGDYDTYAWQVFVQTASSAILDDKSTVEENLANARQRLESGDGKPNSSDGSKGQWRASLTTQIKTYEWLLLGGEQ